MLWRPLAMIAVLGLVGGIGFLLGLAQDEARAGLQERFHTRLELTARFATAYGAEVLEREALIGRRRLADAQPSRMEFEEVVLDLGFEAAVLLDPHGRVLQVFPHRADVVGTTMTGKYPHLDRALLGYAAISGVVPSAAQGFPVIGYAAAYYTPYGRRVLSGAFAVAYTPLSSHLRNALPFAGGEVFLVDPAGSIAASNLDPAGPFATLSDIDAALGSAEAVSPHGRYERDGVSRWFTSVDVPGSPLRLVSSVPTAELYAPVEGDAQVLPWIVVLALGVGSLYTVHVLFALHRSREAFSALSRHDALTGILNRRAFSDEASRILTAARHDRVPVAVLMIDLDRFKTINDSHGHEAGDEVLRVVTDRMRSALRPNDILARWGGEEFVVLLPGTSLADALPIAERLRTAVSSDPIAVTPDQSIVVTASVGCTESLGEDQDAVIGRADRAMYQAKRKGNLVAAG